MLQSMNCTSSTELFLFNSRSKIRSCVNDPSRPQLASRCCSPVTVRLHARKQRCTVFIASILSHAARTQPWERAKHTGAGSAVKAALPTNLLFQKVGFFFFSFLSFHKKEELILPKFTEPEPVILNSNENQFLPTSLQQGSFLEIHKLAGCRAKQSWNPLGISGIPRWTRTMSQGWELEERESDEPGRVSRAERVTG